MTRVWKPSVTVAAVVERDGRFLMVEERAQGGLKINQPAGHLEPGETLLQASVRETLEETARPFHPQSLLGVYLWRSARASTYLRFAFIGSVGEPIATRPLDHGIERTLWLTPQELRERSGQLRSPLVLQCVDDYLAGQRVGLDALYTHPDALEADSARGAL